MKVVFNCIICGSKNMFKNVGLFMPFLAHRYFDYPQIRGAYPGFPMDFAPLMSNIFKCRECGISFTQLRPDDDEMDRYYSDYGLEDYNRARSSMEPWYGEFISDKTKEPEAILNKARCIEEFFEGCLDTVGVKTLLDYGGGSGQSIPELFNLSKKYVLDRSMVSPQPHVTKISSIDDVCGYDLILLMEVLEHVSYPGQILSALKLACKRGTKLFVTVPNEGNQDLESDQCSRHFHEHINHFTLRALATLLVYNGFRVLKFAHVSYIDRRYSNPTVTSLFCLAEPVWFF